MHLFCCEYKKKPTEIQLPAFKFTNLKTYLSGVWNMCVHKLFVKKTLLIPLEMRRIRGRIPVHETINIYVRIA